MTKPEMTFEPFRKIPRYRREIVVTEKLDGTNATIYIDGSGQIFAGSRNRWITPEDDNFGFAAWVELNTPELLRLGAGVHRGEWWGKGVNRGYGLLTRHFSLFNTCKFCLYGDTPQVISKQDNPIGDIYQTVLPACVGLVPVLYSGEHDQSMINGVVNVLKAQGSMAAPGYMNPEGVVIYHTAANVYFKQTIDNDSQPKGKINE